VTVDDITFHLREIRPKDFYFAQIVRQKEGSGIEILSRLLLNDEVLDEATLHQTKNVFNWASEHLLENNVFSVENWLEVSYHMCKQRWDSSIDWLELQPISKIHTMLDIIKKHGEEVEREQKKAARRGK
jgi:hypothetical protein